MITMMVHFSLFIFPFFLQGRTGPAAVRLAVGTVVLTLDLGAALHDFGRAGCCGLVELSGACLGLIRVQGRCVRTARRR